MGFDQRFAMEYHIIGFRECASEVARYLVTIEGMDIQDPLRLRLMSHLQCFVAQRELSAKSSTSAAGVSSTNWQNSYQPNYTSQSAYPQTYPTATPITPHQQQQHNQQQSTASFTSSYMSTPSSSYLTPQSPAEYSSGYGTSVGGTGSANSSSTSAANISSSSGNNNTSTATSPAPVSSTTNDQQQQQQQQQDGQPIYTDLSNTNDRLALAGSYHHYGNANQLYGNGSNTNGSGGYNSNNNNNNNSKPYRPWHPEMAY